MIEDTLISLPEKMILSFRDGPTGTYFFSFINSIEIPYHNNSGDLIVILITVVVTLITRVGWCVIFKTKNVPATFVMYEQYAVRCTQRYVRAVRRDDLDSACRPNEMIGLSYTITRKTIDGDWMPSRFTEETLRHDFTVNPL